jgi:hypothetical protein
MDARIPGRSKYLRIPTDPNPQQWEDGNLTATEYEKRDGKEKQKNPSMKGWSGEIFP